MKKLLLAIALTPLVGCVTPKVPDNVPPPPPKRTGERITAPTPASEEATDEGLGGDGFGGFGGEQPTVSTDVPASSIEESAAEEPDEQAAPTEEEAEEPTSQPSESGAKKQPVDGSASEGE